MEIKVLNKGFVILVDIMGNDSSIVQAEHPMEQE